MVLCARLAVPQTESLKHRSESFRAGPNFLNDSHDSHVDFSALRLRRSAERRISLRENIFTSARRLSGRLGMAEYNFQFRGWHAFVAIAALVGFLGFKTFLRLRSVDDEMRDAVRVELLNEYSGLGRADAARLVAEARAGSTVEPVPPLVQHDVAFPSIAARGDTGARVTLVRAEVIVDGGPPPDGRSVRYFQVSRKFTGGWMVVGTSDSYSYFRELLP